MTTPIGTIGTIGREVCPDAGRFALNIIDMRQAIEGDLAVAWVWAEGEGGIGSPYPPPPRPVGDENTHGQD